MTGPSPFPLRDFFGRLQTAHQIGGDAAILIVIEQNVPMLMGILAVASEMEITPEWQATRMRMLSQAQHDQKLAAKSLAEIAARRYEK